MSGHEVITFWTEPPLTLYLPAEENVDYHHSLFSRIKSILQKGGYDSWDLG